MEPLLDPVSLEPSCDGLNHKSTTVTRLCYSYDALGHPLHDPHPQTRTALILKVGPRTRSSVCGERGRSQPPTTEAEAFFGFSGSPSTAPQYVQDPPRQDTKEKMDLEPTAGRQQSSDAVCMIEKGSDMKRASNIFARMEMQLTRGPLRRVSSNSCFRLILCQSSGSE